MSDILRRSTDQIKTWVSILGPVICLVFGFGIAKATMESSIKQNTERIAKVEGRIDSMADSTNQKDGIYGVSIAKVNEQIASINRRLDRMEDVQDKMFTYITGTPKMMRK